MWTIIGSETFDAWFATLTPRQQAAVGGAVTVLRDRGPTLGRPLVDRLKGSRHHNLKELRVSAGGRRLRVLFVFDPRGTGVLLVGGDKTGAWDDWYPKAIKTAEDLYEQHLARQRDEGILP